MGFISDSGGTGLGSDDPIVGGVGPRRVIRLILSSLDFGLTLNIQLRVRLGNDGNDTNSYRVYYLSPLDVGDSSIVIDQGAAKLNRQFVVDMSSADVISNATVLYTPPGSDGTRRDYSLGGWMYAQPNGSLDDPDPSGTTGLVRVPTFDKNTVPPDKQFGAIALSTTGPVLGIYTTTVNVTNPNPVFGRTQYVQMWMFNYFNDGTFRCLGVYRLHGSPADPNGQNFVYKLEQDGGGHNVVFYAVYLNGQRSAKFAAALSSYQSAQQTGGYP